MIIQEWHFVVGLSGSGKLYWAEKAHWPKWIKFNQMLTFQSADGKTGKRNVALYILHSIDMWIFPKYSDSVLSVWFTCALSIHDRRVYNFGHSSGFLWKFWEQAVIQYSFLSTNMTAQLTVTNTLNKSLLLPLLMMPICLYFLIFNLLVINFENSGQIFPEAVHTNWRLRARDWFIRMQVLRSGERSGCYKAGEIFQVQRKSR